MFKFFPAMHLAKDSLSIILCNLHFARHTFPTNSKSVKVVYYYILSERVRHGKVCTSTPFCMDFEPNMFLFSPLSYAQLVKGNALIICLNIKARQ